MFILNRKTGLQETLCFAYCLTPRGFQGFRPVVLQHGGRKAQFCKGVATGSKTHKYS